MTFKEWLVEKNHATQNDVDKYPLFYVLGVKRLVALKKLFNKSKNKK